MTCFIEAEYSISKGYSPRLSSSDTLAQNKITCRLGPRYLSDWAEESEKERLGEWPLLMLYSGKMSVKTVSEWVFSCNAG